MSNSKRLLVTSAVILTLMLGTSAARLLLVAVGGLNGPSALTSALAAGARRQVEHGTINSDGDNLGGYLKNVEIIDLSNNNTHLINLTKAPKGLCNFGGISVNDTIYIVGGESDGLTIQSLFWAYNINSNTWNTNVARTPFPYDVSDIRLLYKNSTLYTIAGLQWDSDVPDYLTSMFSVDMSGAGAANGIWRNVTTAAALPATYDGTCVLTVPNDTSKIYYVVYGQVFVSPDFGQSWSNPVTTPKAYRVYTACVMNADATQILIAGGATNYTLAVPDVEIFDIPSNTWRVAAPLPEPRNGPAAVTMPDGSALVCGGLNDTEYGTCVAYDWKLNVWNSTNIALNIPRSHFGLYLANL